MIINHTDLKEFDIFEEKYSNILVSSYNHIKKCEIHCYTSEKYRILEKVPIADFSHNDVMGFAFDDTNEDNNINAAIIISPHMCNKLRLSGSEILSAIAHELGHIIYLNNEMVRNASTCFQEIYADGIAARLGLSQSLILLLKKLKTSNLYSQEQIICFDFRIKMLEINF